MAKTAISKEIKQEVIDRVEQFNRKELHSGKCAYVARFRGKFLYLDRSDYGRTQPICRLEFTGDINDWEFSIFKWSSERYDSNEWFFPGSGEIDGTVEGAMRAGLGAYPV